jgi:DNA-binding response OmpR family regulator
MTPRSEVAAPGQRIAAHQRPRDFRRHRARADLAVALGASRPAAAEQVAASKPAPDAVLIDARRDLVQARRLLRTLRAGQSLAPVIVIVSEGGWAATSADWGTDDFLLYPAGPAEVEARLRLVIGRSAQASGELPNEIRSGELVVNGPRTRPGSTAARWT